MILHKYYFPFKGTKDDVTITSNAPNFDLDFDIEDDDSWSNTEHQEMTASDYHEYDGNQRKMQHTIGQNYQI